MAGAQVLFFLGTSHIIGCAFYALAYRAPSGSSEHYEYAPWKPLNESRDDGFGSLYVRALYWSVMTLTTTGHVDILDRTGRDWEVIAALVVSFAATFIFIYVNANFTSIFLRLNTRMENYRSRLNGIDTYLKRNKVSRELRKVVRKHFEATYNQNSDQQVLEQQTVSPPPL